MGEFAGKVALISGGAEGIGAGTARAFVERGGKVVLGDVQAEKVEALADELGDSATAVKLDVRELADWEAAAARAQEQFGKLTHLFNIAGISEPGSAAEVDPDSWHRTIGINLTGTFNGCKVGVNAIEQSSEAGAIVNVGSMLGLRPGADFAAYCASKAGVAALSQTVALDCAARGLPIRCNTVHPGAIRTPMFERYLEALPGSPDEVEAMFASNHPMGRVGEAGEVVEAILFLASERASFTTGVDFTVDGGGSIRS
ncbi:SDR family NAD(P)-dependent oxidoreductase [Erythrobacter sp.]|jgi:3alpha(or 20beta)-hydroxysteroid dehydrogenase|uniref:SDR family NAD(P)-dependent oxidoreductase n=1 Tax=Erythrobacter sp. TaxID=1042 RepID=UPI002EB4A582|nr:SDR family oxidoreductase [Erythrobacter sp.]